MATKTWKDKLARRKRQREDVLGDMTPELQEVYQAIKAKSEDQCGKEILVAHEVGLMVRDVAANERKYGESAVPDLALALGGAWTLEDLWDLRAIANAYTEATVRKLAKRRTAGGNLLTLNHVRQIASRPRERDKWLNYVFQEDLTTVELNAAILEKYGQKSPRRSPTINAPRGVLSGLKQICSYSDALGKRVGVWDRHVFGKILKVSSDDCTNELLDQLDRTLEAERETITHAQHIIDRAEKAKERVQRVIGLRKSPRDSSTGHDGAPPDTPVVEKPATRRMPVKKKTASAAVRPSKKSKSKTPNPSVSTKKTVKKRKVKRSTTEASGRPEAT